MVRIYSNLFCVLCLLFLGCDQGNITILERPEYNSKGDIVIHKVKCNNKIVYTYSLRNDYGIMIFTNYSKKSDKIKYNLYKLYNRKDSNVLITRCIETFLKGLDDIPTHDTIDFYNTCVSSFDNDLHFDVIPKIKNACERKGVILISTQDYDRNILCTCNKCGP